MRKKLFLWLPVLAWASLVFYLSSIPNLRAVASNFWDEIIRSLAHFCLYGLGYFLLFRALNGNFLLALILTVGYALSDETHQLFVPTRAFQIQDLMIDWSGAGLGGLILWLKKS